MKDEKIIKALECFAIDKDFDERRCIGCAFETKGLCCENCSDGLAKLSLDLINRQKAEIKCLKNDRDFWESAAKTEIGDILKEFAERVKEKTLTIVRSPDLLSESDYIECIDSLVEEMVGCTD